MRYQPLIRLGLAVFCVGVCGTVEAGGPALLRDVRVAPSSFIPALRQKATLSFRLQKAGDVSASVVDRDGYLVRVLTDSSKRPKGLVRLEWDGRDAKGGIAPNEAYSFKIDVKAGKRRESYFPANAEPEMLLAKASYFDRSGGVFVYDLPRPGRVHAQAGVSTLDPTTGAQHGPVLKTLVNREPRLAGRIVETWDGLDESGTIYVPDLPDFVASIMVTTLPENSVIAVGSRGPSLLERAKARVGESLFSFKPSHHHHHLGLTVREDISPPLALYVKGASFIPEQKSWRLEGETLQLTVKPTGPAAEGFVRHPATLYVFRGTTELRKASTEGQEMSVQLSRSDLPPGVHVLALGWSTDYGPSAAISMRLSVETERDSTASMGAGK